LKLTILQRQSAYADIPDEEIRALWEQGRDIPGIDDFQILPIAKAPTPETVDEMVGDSDAVIGLFISSRLLTEQFFQKHPRLKYAAGLAHGYEDMDFAMTRRYGVTLTNTAYGASTIAEFAMSLLLAICHRPEQSSSLIKSADWESSEPKPRFMSSAFTQIELLDKTMGIIGLGKIGVCTARMARSFGMSVVAYSRSQKEGPEYEGIRQVSLDELLANSDVIQLHCALNAGTRGIINKTSIAKMKDGVILINTSRGALIDEDALVEALKSGKILAAGLDVLSEEPPKRQLPILSCENAIITPHIAWLPKTSRLRQVKVALENFRNYLEGRPTGVVNQ
jgi:glycerate dehydrogenase